RPCSTGPLTPSWQSAASRTCGRSTRATDTATWAARTRSTGTRSRTTTRLWIAARRRLWALGRHIARRSVVVVAWVVMVVVVGRRLLHLVGPVVVIGIYPVPAMIRPRGEVVVVAIVEMNLGRDSTAPHCLLLKVVLL